MNWLSRLERRLGRWSVPHLTEILAVGQLLTWGALLGNPQIADALPLIPQRVLAGEWWRLLTFPFMPPVVHPLFLFFALYLFYLMGKALESSWGEFRYNLFWLVGLAASLLAACADPTAPATNAYLMGSVLLAFAFLYPDFQILLFFVLPVKVKWIAWFTAVMYGLAMAGAIRAGALGHAMLVMAALLNVALFFGSTVWQRFRGGYRRRQRVLQQAEARETPFHTCSVCGATEKSRPDLEFRYRREAGEVLCYCLDHLPAEK